MFWRLALALRAIRELPRFLTTFATGLPIALSERNDPSLAGSSGTDVPNFTPGKVLNDTNPRHENPYFNTSLFSKEQLGQIGNSNRRFFHGPGLNNWDLALVKDTRITESKALQFRVETFNTWNHAQFENPSGSINSSTFGVVTSTRPHEEANARVMQLGAKLIF